MLDCLGWIEVLMHISHVRVNGGLLALIYKLCIGEVQKVPRLNLRPWFAIFF